MEVRLGEVTVERCTVGPLLDGDEAERVLDGCEEAVAQAAILPARVVLHLLEQRNELFAVLGRTPHAADHEQHS